MHALFRCASCSLLLHAYSRTPLSCRQLVSPSLLLPCLPSIVRSPTVHANAKVQSLVVCLAQAVAPE